VKDPKKKKDHLFFMNYGVKKFTSQKTFKKKTLMFERYNLVDPFRG
jgi:hypothetical protein